MKKIVLFFVLCMAATAATAQSDDFGLWTAVEVQTKINRKWNVGAEAEMRRQNSLKSPDRWTVGVSGTYKPLKWLKLEAGYKFIHYYSMAETKAKVTKFLDDEETDPKNIKIRTSDPYWNNRHRLHLSATLHKKFGNVELSLREQWQYNFRTKTTTNRHGTKYMMDEWESEPIPTEIDSVKSKSSHYLRSRFQVQYDKKGCPWQPYANVEMYNGGDHFGIHKMRYTVGLEYKITKQHVVEVYYRYQHNSKEDNGENLLNTVMTLTDDAGTPVFSQSGANYDPSLFGNNDRSSHILGIGYKLKF
ncbi:MAG: DUF2490 domain-containing protein [Prevotella sp.]|nr:DUF2490 domain-containing protein [Prevotella sp.]